MRLVVEPVAIHVLGVPSVEKTRSVEPVISELIGRNETMSIGDVDDTLALSRTVARVDFSLVESISIVVAVKSVAGVVLALFVIPYHRQLL
jgi:hypothetical protein